MAPRTGISTPSFTTARTAFSPRGIRARYKRRIEAWNSMKTTIDRGKCATPHAVTARRTTTVTVAEVGRSSIPRSAPAIAIRRAPSTGRATLRCGPGRFARGPSSSGALPHDLTEQALGPENQDQDQDGEREDVLVLGAEGAAREQREVGGGKGFEQAQHQPAHHGARDVADAAENGGGECLEARDEPRVGIDEAVLHTEEHARGAAHGSADQERQWDDPGDVEGPEARGGRVV